MHVPNPLLMNWCVRIAAKDNNDYLYPYPPILNVARSSYTVNPNKESRHRKKDHALSHCQIVMQLTCPCEGMDMDVTCLHLYFFCYNSVPVLSLTN